MADVEIKVPSLGESETEATLVSWLKDEGDPVAVDDVLAEIESDKITMEITALDAGTLKSIHKQVDDVVEPGEVIGLIDTSMIKEKKTSIKKEEKAVFAEPETRSEAKKEDKKENKEEAKKENTQKVEKIVERTVEKRSNVSPVTQSHAPQSGERIEERVAMSGLRKRIATRLKDAQNTAAMLTTFNEVNLQPVMDLRAKYKEKFQTRHGVGLGFMSFFIKACAYASGQFPAMNAFIDGDEVVYHNYMDIGVAVSTDKGLVVPVLRDAGKMSFADIEQGVASLASRAREGGLMPDDLKGGTFSITNGGVFGSLLSTPIVNPPQSGILGMHAIQQRPVAENGQVVVRPMMYLALTYDHRLIDGSEAVQFLVAVKAYLEQPGVALLDL